MKKVLIILLATMPIISQASQVCGEVTLGSSGCDVDICAVSFVVKNNSNRNVFVGLMDQGRAVNHDYDLQSVSLNELLSVKNYCVDSSKIINDSMDGALVDVSDLVAN